MENRIAIKMFSDKQARYFISLCATGSFSRTAESFNVSRQVISKSIASMEEQLGLKLLDRNGQRAALTEAGSLVNEYLADELARFDILAEKLGNLKNKSAVGLTIGFQDFMSVGTDMSGFLRSANQKYGISIELKRYSPANLFKRLVNKRLDMIVVAERYAVNIDQFAKLRLGKKSTFLVVSARHPKAKPGATLADFRNEPLIADILEGESKAEFNARIQKESASYGLTPSYIIDEPNWDSAYMNVRMGRGVMISAASSRFFNTEGTLTYDTGAKDAILCLWRKDSRQEEAAGYAKFLKKIIGGASVDF